MERTLSHRLRRNLSPLINSVVLRQWEKVAEKLNDHREINLSYFPSTPWRLATLLCEHKDKKKVVILMPDVNKLIDFVQYLPESILKLGGWMLSVATPNKYWKRVWDIMNDSWVVWYIGFMAKASKERFFKDKMMELIVVRAASKQDAIDCISLWGENTVLILSWHWNSELSLMSDWERFSNTDIQSQWEKLKAFIQHTCGGGNPKNPLWIWLAQEVYGYNRWVHPVEYLVDPFRQK
jgi:hypothetical protein